MHGYSMIANIFGNDRQGLNMWHVIVEPGQVLDVHNHPCVEIYLVTEGTGLLTVAEETELVEEGDCIFVDENQLHCFVNNSTENCKIIAVSHLHKDAPYIRT